MSYRPPQKIIEKYADVLVNFALNKGRGIKKGEIVRLSCGEFAEPLYIAVNKAILKAGGHVLHNYYPNDDRKTFNPTRDFYELADDSQLRFFPKKYLKALANTIDHNIYIEADVDKEALKGIEPKKIMLSGEIIKPFKKWLDKKENAGKFSWTMALYGTPAGSLIPCRNDAHFPTFLSVSVNYGNARIRPDNIPCIIGTELLVQKNEPVSRGLPPGL